MVNCLLYLQDGVFEILFSLLWSQWRPVPKGMPFSFLRSDWITIGVVRWLVLRLVSTSLFDGDSGSLIFNGHSGSSFVCLPSTFGSLVQAQQIHSWFIYYIRPSPLLWKGILKCNLLKWVQWICLCFVPMHFWIFIKTFLLLGLVAFNDSPALLQLVYRLWCLLSIVTDVIVELTNV